MGNYLTANVALNLYWLGRYIERIEATLIEVEYAFDKIIDVDKNAGVTLFNQLGITLEYKNSMDFLKKALYGEHDSNVYDLISCARENAIISRSAIETDALGAIIELQKYLQKGNNITFSVDCTYINFVLERISGIWGTLTRKLKREKGDYFIRLGKLVEKVDFHLRTGKDREFALIMMDEIDAIVSILAPEASFKPHNVGELHEIILDSINAKINKIITEEQ